MPEFELLFRESKGQPIQYNGVVLKRIDRFPVKNGDVLACSIEEAIKKDEYLQGFCIDVTGYCEFDGEIHKKGKGIRVMFWDGYTHPNTMIKVFTKLDHVIIYNVCEIDIKYFGNDIDGSPLERHAKRLDSKYNGAAMIVEEIEGGRRYRCSDTSSADKPFPFEDIIFTVKNLGQEMQPN